MTVTKVVAKIYDHGPNGRKLSKASGNGFNEELAKASDKEVCKQCGQANETEAQAKSSEVNSTEEAGSDSETVVVESSVSYHFSMFVRLSGDFNQIGEQIANKFHQATSSFVDALKVDESAEFSSLGGYLKMAQNAVMGGEQSSENFFNKMIEAADTGIKAITNTMQSQSWMQGMNLSMNSSMPGTSAADIAQVHLSNAFSAMDTQLSSGYTGSKDYGLQLISSKELVMNSSSTPPVSSQDNKIQMLEKFMGMVEKFLEGISAPKEEKHEGFFQFSIYKHTAGISAELEKEAKPVEAVENSSDEAVAETKKVTA